jgi:hypothetical protein
MDKVKTLTRDKNGLVSGVDYIFDDSGLIDWRKMIKPEFLVPNRDRTNQTDVSKLKDHELIILLGGIKELAQIRGYTDVSYQVVSPSPEYVIATCKITWTPNYETEGKEVSFSAIADASPHNTNEFGQIFLAACAENRAFVRCVRNFLRINVVSKEELKLDSPNKFAANKALASGKDEQIEGPHGLLSKTMRDKGVTFDIVKTKLIEEKYEEANSFQDVSDIPKSKVFELIDRLKKL